MKAETSTQGAGPQPRKGPCKSSSAPRRATCSLRPEGALLLGDPLTELIKGNLWEGLHSSLGQPEGTHVEKQGP